jgi:putative hydrolase of the HAD superfamily
MSSLASPHTATCSTSPSGRAVHETAADDAMLGRVGHDDGSTGTTRTGELSDIDAVVFDLGGVVAEFSGVERMTALARLDSDEEMWRRWLTCEWVRRFERGSCEPADFAAGVVGDWSLELTPEAFLAEFATWLVGPLPGAEELVEATRAHVTTACLSNTNRVHWDAGAGSWPLLRSFDRTFLSFELGMVKPDPEIFERVVDELSVPPRRVLFLDDNVLNVDAAQQVGLSAVRVRGVVEARDALVTAGVLACPGHSAPAVV